MIPRLIRRLGPMLALAACSTEVVLPPSPPPPPPVLQSLTIGLTGRRVQAMVGGRAPEDVATVVVSGVEASAATWTVERTGSWIGLATASGTGSGMLAWLREATGLAPGLHIDTITVTLPGASGSPAQIVDTLEILPSPTSPTLLVSPRSLRTVIRYGEAAPDGAAAVSVLPTTGASASWCVASAGSSLELVVPSPVGGTACEAEASAPVRWHRRVVDRTPGLYVDTLTVTATGAIGTPTRILDTLVVLPGPGPLRITASAIARSAITERGSEALGDSVAITVTGLGSVGAPWGAEASASWLELLADGGAGSAQLRWRRRTAALPAGIYVDTIRVTLVGAEGSPLTIVDTVRVDGGPVTASIVMPPDAFAGSELQLVSEAFPDRGAGAFITVGSRTVELTRRDATTLVGMLPESIVAGSLPVMLHLDARTVALGDLQVHGFVGSRTFPLVIPYDTYAWPRDGAASVLGQTSDGLTSMNLETGDLHVWPVPSDWGMRGPGPTPEDSVFLVRGNGSLQSWRLGPAPVRIETFDDFFTPESRQEMLLSPNHMLHVGGQHSFQLYHRSGPGSRFVNDPWHEFDAEEVEGVYLSPRKDRATIRVDGIREGLPVFDALAGTIAYHVTPMWATYGVDFSADGSLLAVGGATYTGTYHPRVMLLDATSGAVIADTTLDRRIFAVALDPVRPHLYVGLEDPARGPGVLVLERDTFRPLGLMFAPQGATPSCCYRGVIAPSRTTSTVHVFWWQFAWAFSLPDAP